MERATIHRHIYLVLLALLGGSMVTSVWLSNLVWVLLLVNWLVEGRWREKWQMACESRLLQAFLVLYLTFIIGMAWTSNLGHGLSVLQVKMPLLFVPLVLLTTRPATGRARHLILNFYALTVLVVSIIGLVRMLTIPDLPYREMVPYVSHIRFALNCCMVICLCVGLIVQRKQGTPVLQTIIGCMVLLWMLAFVMLLHSYTAVAVLAIVSLVLLLTHYRRWPLIALWVLLAGGASAAVLHEVHNYYSRIPQATAPLRTYTDGNRPYMHAQDGMVENGNYINNYLCPEELSAEWEKRSTMAYDSMTNEGYTVGSTLIRYLNALGLTKDSVGVHALTAEQVHDIEQGVANPVYHSHNPLRRMVYVMLLEHEFHKHTHSINGFTMLQRYELWGTSIDVIREHPWFGVGTGDVDDQIDLQLVHRQSDLAGSGKRSHNQYLGLLAAFGIVGFLLLTAIFIRPLRKSSALRSPLMLAWMLTILISMLTEDTLDTLAGQLLCTWFLAFRPLPDKQ